MNRRLTALVLVLVLAAAFCATAAPIIVDVGGSGDYLAIKPAVAAAVEGDTVLVMPGTYTGDDNKDIYFGGKNIELRGDGGSAVTIIDCEDNANPFDFAPGEVGSATIIEGFTVTRCEDYSGGAFYCWGCSPTIIDCVFSDSFAFYGGALYVHDCAPSFINCAFTGNESEHGGAVQIEMASPTFTDCEFSNNVSTGEAGGVDCIWDASPSFTDCTFSGNSATHGGGLRCYDNSSPTILRCDFIENDASSRGGGAFCDSTSSPTISYCSFQGNTAAVGGGLSCEGNSSPAVSNTSFDSNDGGNGGGGLYTDFSSPTFYLCSFKDNLGRQGGGAYCYESTSTFNVCVFAGNYSADSRASGGGAIYCDSADIRATYVTFVDNGADTDAGGVHCYLSDPTLDGCIIAFSTSGPAVTCETGTESPILECCDIYGNAGGDWVGCIASWASTWGNFSADPLFCDRPGGDYSLDAASPCAADNSGPSCDAIGGLFVDCDSPVEATTWGVIKSMYR